MDLDKFKSAWQNEELILPATETKNMNQIHQIIENKVSDTLAKQEKYFTRSMVRTALVPIVFIIFFYFMSDGFTNDNDSVGALFTIVALFAPVFLFFWSRYRQTVSWSTTLDADVRTSLPQTIGLLQRQQKMEIGLILLLAVFLGIGILFSGSRMGFLPAFFSLTLITIVGGTVWYGYNKRLSELKGYVSQLSE